LLHFRKTVAFGYQFLEKNEPNFKKSPIKIKNLPGFFHTVRFGLFMVSFPLSSKASEHCSGLLSGKPCCSLGSYGEN